MRFTNIQPDPSLRVWAICTILFLVINAVQYLSSQTIQRVLDRARASETRYRSLMENIPAIEGTCAGLTLAKRIIEVHVGHIGSNQDQEKAPCFYLPCPMLRLAPCLSRRTIKVYTESKADFHENQRKAASALYKDVNRCSQFVKSD